jgi:hypothetical protein
MQREVAWEFAAAGGGGSSSSSTSVYLTETLQKLKQANSCCRKLGLGRQYALAPCSKPRWQLQHIAVEVWQCCPEQQQGQEQQQDQQGDTSGQWQLNSSLTLAQFNRQLDKLLAKVASTATAAQAPPAAAYTGGGGSNCSSLFSSPAGSRPCSPARTRPGSATATCSSMRTGTAAHSAHAAGQFGGAPDGWFSPDAIAIPEGGCRTSSRLSPRRQQQQQQQTEGLASLALSQGQPLAVLGASNQAVGSGGVGGRAVRGGVGLPYAVPAWLEDHL